MGQYNYKTALNDSLVRLLSEVGEYYNIKPSRFATRIYHDPKYENRIIQRNFAANTPVEVFFKKNGQIVHVKLDQPDYDMMDEEPSESQKLSMDEIYQLTLRPEE